MESKVAGIRGANFPPGKSNGKQWIERLYSNAHFRLSNHFTVQPLRLYVGLTTI
jgi:hypothetical protein